ncbi:S41 family peptidase [Pseudoalteromonas tunicata]|jgi:carboxyl-terminal processing protease|uniref:Putative carboxyl-terminal protease n=1 Tax=Pseudoalteromonas tunicata D2 TaxID=87626 RepID=A4C7A7_9GAMM|nr:S41 family peptidase [Pseudoalteromonas tunicata]ATC95831.1 carboxyl-terminal processing protease [Pseudoalteromonas tunicata]AXT31377.1 S41 family peptidase [Pseudoalteromonas tunicata]EAR29861.1 putative carboxyl-terminal protease [Pseudoalteromonas tunicata D2]
MKYLSQFIVCFYLTFTLPSSAQANEPAAELQDILEHIQAFYVDEIDPKKLNHTAIDSLIKQLDPHSDYLDPEELEDLFNIANGQYTGLGIEVEQRDEHIIIVSALPNSPASHAGIKKGDILLKVNNETVINEPIKKVAALISKSKTPQIKLAIARSGYSDALQFTLEREKIAIESVSGQLNEHGYASIRISNFNNHTLHDLARLLAQLANENGQNLKGLLIDLRDNPGGVLGSAVDISDLFLQHGTIVTTKGRFYDANHKYLAKTGDVLNGAPIVVLINKGSASAAEILAGALKDNQRAIVVGTRSYGKGSVQSLIPLGDGHTALKLTTAKYYTPSGQSIDGIGIVPDIAIEQSKLPSEDGQTLLKMSSGNNNQPLLTAFRDVQLEEAQKILKKY